MNDHQSWPEKRELDRHVVGAHVDVVDLGSGRLVGRLVNIHEQGLMLLGRSEMEGNRQYRLRLETDPSIEVAVDCLWLNPASGDGYWVGCRITDIGKEGLDQLRQMGWW